jgi:methylated-DNA-[protein]-cysteine S-methyltransferase
MNELEGSGEPGTGAPENLEARLAGFDPPVLPPVLPDSDVSYVVTDTPVGRLVLAATEAALVACSYDAEDQVTERLARLVSPRVLRSARRLDPVRRELDGYFAGRVRRFGVPVDLALAGPFARRVLRRLERVPYGATTTYGEVAGAVGSPGAARAVGLALRANPVCIVVPCHRVVAADGRLTGYAGGLDAKRLLLDLERGPAAPDRPPSPS